LRSHFARRALPTGSTPGTNGRSFTVTRRFLLAAALCLAFSLPAFATTYTVNDLGDAPDLIVGDNACATLGMVCTLRAAIEEANAHAGADFIVFSVAGTITPATAFPTITEKVTIDASGAPMYMGIPVVIVRGAGMVTIGIDIGATATQCVIQALQIDGFTQTGVNIAGTSSAVLACYLGPVAGGTANGTGMQISGSGNFVGSVTVPIANIISGNSSHGISILSGSGHSIVNSRIGLDQGGMGTIPNGGDGIHVLNGTMITIGSATAAFINVITGNNGNGVTFDTSTNNTVAGNYIGVDAFGTTGLGNKGAGVSIDNGSDNIKVGLAGAGNRNVISANSRGVEVLSGSTNVIVNNYIGTNATGTNSIGNNTNGVNVSSSGTTVGAPGSGNLISGNSIGVFVTNAAANVKVQANNIGLDAAGTTIIGNQGDGIQLSNTGTVTIGGTAAGEGNVISGNGNNGIDGSFAAGGTIQGNLIGLTADGSDVRGNGNNGIILGTSSGITIGGSVAGARNVISGNSDTGVYLVNSATGITVRGNYIGTDITGTTDQGNLNLGVRVEGADTNVIDANVISGNDQNGILIDGTTTGTTVTSNTIGRTFNNSAALGNGMDGIRVSGTSINNTFGGTGTQNIIASNGGVGIYIFGEAPDNNVFPQNSIFGNGNLGIDLGPGGVTANDAVPGDPDIGVNTLQNFPVLASAVTTGSASRIGGTINSDPNTALSIHFYSSPAADPSGNGEGQTWLGSTNVMTEGNGDASFIFTNASPLTVGQVVSSTANGPHGTSEFSATQLIATAPTVQFSSATYSVGEGGGSILITVTRSGDTSGTTTVDYATSNGTATSPADYTLATGTLTFAPTVTSQTFTVFVTQDLITEGSETVNLTLSNPQVATLGAQSTALLTITDDEIAPAISINDVSQNEGNALTSTFPFTVSLSNPSASTVTVNWATNPVTATAGTDYVTTSGTVTFMPGVTSQPVNVTVTGDTTFEPNETFTVDLTMPSGATIADNQGLGTIVNDDSSAVADLSLAKTAQESQNQVTYTIVVNNLGPNTATNVTMTDVLPVGVNFVSAMTTSGSCSGTSTVTCTSPTLANGASVTITIVVQATTSFNVYVTNTATVTATEPDPNPTNNTASAAANIPTMSMLSLMLLGAILAMVAAITLR
jgi:parallel beta-helix repeat protein